MSEQFVIELAELADDLVLEILLQLDNNYVNAICQNNKRYQRDFIMNENGVMWKLLYQRDFSQQLPTFITSNDNNSKEDDYPDDVDIKQNNLLFGIILLNTPISIPRLVIISLDV